MSTTLQLESFSDINLRERTQVTAGADAGASAITVDSVQGYTDGDVIYIGQLAREGCERAVIASRAGETTINLVEPLKRAHARFEPVVSVLGDTIHVYRAANIDGKVPADDAFTVLATRSIDPDQESTYYTDSAGSSNFWYRGTYYNPSTNDETALKDSVPTRGDDFGHYASVTEIRREAGFENAVNLSDVDVDQQRRAAESEINSTLANNFTTPFTPVPEIIHTITVQLAAALLRYHFTKAKAAQDDLKAIRARLAGMAAGDGTITDDDGQSISTGTGVSSYPFDETAPRAFTVDMRF